MSYQIKQINGSFMKDTSLLEKLNIPSGTNIKKISFETQPKYFIAEGDSIKPVANWIIINEVPVEIGLTGILNISNIQLNSLKCGNNIDNILISCIY